LENIMAASFFEFERLARPRPHIRNRETSGPHFDVHAISVPARMFTGDFWFTHRTDDRLWFALGDVAGKGLPAALVMAMIQEELERRIASCARAGCDPATTMLRLHEFLKPLLPSNRFATAVIGWLGNDGTMTIVNAGHCPPMLVRANGRIEEIDSTGPVVGIMSSSRWTSTTLTLDDGDQLILYSDGVIEAASPDGEEFGVEGIMRALPVCSSSRDVASAIHHAASRHARGARYDDLSLLVIGR
jgi:sigma-B regulation protein RsbU (phosphoserine phosphatase)